ncbi:hypothetical protein ON010_g13598 [Phytophthora cinnamomi]|nr:hypothetical protein ON010_g13598 [Phytophthora cinnamomi]
MASIEAGGASWTGPNVGRGARARPALDAHQATERLRSPDARGGGCSAREEASQRRRMLLAPRALTYLFHVRAQRAVRGHRTARSKLEAACCPQCSAHVEPQASGLLRVVKADVPERRCIGDGVVVGWDAAITHSPLAHSLVRPAFALTPRVLVQSQVICWGDTPPEQSATTQDQTRSAAWSRALQQLNARRAILPSRSLASPLSSAPYGAVQVQASTRGGTK